MIIICHWSFLLQSKQANKSVNSQIISGIFIMLHMYDQLQQTSGHMNKPQNRKLQKPVATCKNLHFPRLA